MARKQIIIYAEVPDELPPALADGDWSINDAVEMSVESRLPKSLFLTPHEGQVIEWGGVTCRDAS